MIDQSMKSFALLKAIKYNFEAIIQFFFYQTFLWKNYEFKLWFKTQDLDCYMYLVNTNKMTPKIEFTSSWVLEKISSRFFKTLTPCSRYVI